MKKIAIIGAASLTGNKLIEILNNHPKAKVALATSQTFAGQAVTGTNLSYKPLNLDEIAGCDVVFSCLPHGKSIKMLPQLADMGKLVIDLGVGFRTPADLFEKWYGLKHEAAGKTPATYGLSEVFAEEIAQSKFIANPGCYPTSILLVLAPLLKQKIVLEDVSIFSLSGRSGAGREKAIELEKQGENVFSYKDPYSHQHIGEIEFIGSKLFENNFKLFLFEPNVLCNVLQGIRSTIVAKADLVSVEALHDLFADYYKDQPFVKVKKINDGSQITLQDNVGSNNCSIGLQYDKQTKRLYIISVIDNLIKGASGQAVQNMNIAMGWKQELGF